MVSGMRKFASFGYAIDYDKEIAIDEARIAHLSSCAVVEIAKLIEVVHGIYPDYQCDTVYALVLGLPEHMRQWLATLLGVPADSLRTWAVANEYMGDTRPGDHSVADGLDKQFASFDICTESARTKALSKARSDLARHKRNKAKYT